MAPLQLESDFRVHMLVVAVGEQSRVTVAHGMPVIRLWVGERGSHIWHELYSIWQVDSISMKLGPKE